MLTACLPACRRVGVIRHLRLGQSLRREGPHWFIDTQELRHKTTKFYGPSVTKLPPEIGALIERYKQYLESAFKHEESRRYIFYAGTDLRCIESSNWTQYVKGLFKKFSPHKTETPPKLLRGEGSGLPQASSPRS